MHIITGFGVCRAGQIITKRQANHCSAVAFRKCPTQSNVNREGQELQYIKCKNSCKVLSLHSGFFLKFLIKVSHENMLAVDKEVICKRREGAVVPAIRLLLPRASAKRLLVAQWCLFHLGAWEQKHLSWEGRSDGGCHRGAEESQRQEEVM